MTMARMKFAIGPAATIAARAGTLLWWKLTLRSSSDIAASVDADGVLASLSSPKNFT